MVYSKTRIIGFPCTSPARQTAGFSFMWFKKDPYKSIKKTDLYKKIIDYGQDVYELLRFALHVAKARIEEITLEDIKSYYKAIVEPEQSLWTRQSMMKSVRKFFRYYRGVNILKADLITDNPLNIVEKIAIIEPMKKVIEKERKAGRPRDLVSIRKVVALRKEGITFRQIAQVLKKDPSQVFVWWRDRDILLS